MQFRTLLQKNFIYWKRNWVSSLLQIIVPVVIVLVLISLRTTTAKFSFSDSSSTFVSFFTQNKVISSAPALALRGLMKKCGQLPGGGSIALTPNNTVTQHLADYFNRSGFNSMFFETDEALTTYVRDPEYNTFSLYASQSPRTLICLGVSFSRFETRDYAYSLRFNQSNIFNRDYFEGTKGGLRVEFRKDAPEYYAQTVGNGTMQLKALVDSLILELETNVTMQISAKKMDAGPSEYANFMVIEVPLVIALVLSVLVPYLRIISMILSERESLVLDHLENMGMSRSRYLLAALIWVFGEQVFLGLILSGVIKGALLPRVNYGVLLLTFYFFCFATTSLGFLIASLFFRARNGLVAAVGVISVLIFAYIIFNAVGGDSPSSLLGLCFDPVGACGVLVNIFLNFESAFRDFGFGNLSGEVGGFAPGLAWLIMAIEGIIFIILGLYLFHVIPFEFGIARHPLFIFGWPWRSRKVFRPPATDIEMREIDGKNEAVEAVLAQQKEANRTVSIEQLSKTYRSGKTALVGVTLDLFAGQIFVLLGQNGAGKSTLVSIISGLAEATSGWVRVMGRDPAVERSWVRSKLGCCPQTNPLISFLTVEEHMNLSARIKTGQNPDPAEISSLLADLGLDSKRNDICQKLSGGQKRKLCVALALLGRSQVVLLDEPTSGMDPLARRQLWDVLKKYKQDRVILLTTHNMDEADYLADRIGLMDHGSMVATGSPLFLKNKFGMGYTLTIFLHPKSPPFAPEKLKQLVARAVGHFEVLSQSPVELKLRLPLNRSPEFIQLLASLETQTDLFVKSFSISQTTLNEVFVRALVRAPFSKPQNTFPNSTEKDRYQNSINGIFDTDASIRDDSDMPLHARKQRGPPQLLLQSRCRIFSQQVYGLLVKRVKNIYRNLFTLFMEVVFPIILLVAGFALVKINFVGNTRILSIAPSLYPKTQTFIAAELPGAVGSGLSVARTIGLGPAGLSGSVLSAGSIEEFGEELVERKATHQIFGLAFSNLSEQFVNYTVFFNSTAPFAGLLGMNVVNSALLRLLTNQTNAKIETTLDPLPSTKKIEQMESSGDGFVIVLFISLAFTFMATSIVAVLVREREKDSKHQQLISGVRVFTYWISNFIIDYVKYIILAMFIFASFYMFGTRYFTVNPAGVISFLILVWYGIPFLLTIYFFSLMFRKAFSAQVFTFLFVFLTSFFLLSLTNALRLSSKTRGFAQKGLQNIFRFIPFYAFGNGLLNISNLTLYIVIYNLSYTPNAIDFTYGALIDFVYLFFMGFGIFMAILAVEGIEYVKATFSCCLSKRNNNTGVLEQMIGSPDVKDSFVIAEERTANSVRETNILMKHVSKIFRVSSFFEKKRILKAVNDMSLIVEPGTVLGLLGANGAGKSTSFRMLTADTKATSGIVSLKGRLMPSQIDEIRSDIGFCPQTDNLFDFLTVREHFELFCRLKGIAPQNHEALIIKLLIDFNLGEFENVLTRELSGGNKRKVSVAIAFLGNPPLIFLDEPTSGMDPDAKLYVRRAIMNLTRSSQQSSVVLTTHSMEEAENSTTKIAIMVDGKLQTVGSTPDIRRKYANGYEIEIKLELPTQEFYNSGFEFARKHMGFLPAKELDAIELTGLLGIMNRPFLKAHIAENASGAFIKSRFDQRLTVPLHLILEWVDLTTKIEVLRQAMWQYFGGTIIEIMHSYIKFRTETGQPISRMFNYLEGNRQELGIKECSFREISLEHIFVQFVRKAQRRYGNQRDIS